jgi:hypothetical protein
MFGEEMDEERRLEAKVVVFAIWISQTAISIRDPMPGDRPTGVSQGRRCDRYVLQEIDSVLTKLQSREKEHLMEPRFSAKIPTAWNEAQTVDGLRCLLRCSDNFITRVSPNLVWSDSPGHQRSAQ